MDFVNYLLDELNKIEANLGIENKILVSEYRSFEMPKNKEDLLFVVRYITGSYVGNVKTQPVQIFCYSQLNDMQSAYMILDEFAKTHNNYQLSSNEERAKFADGNDVRMNYETPVSMRNFIQSEAGYRASVYCYGTYVEFENSVIIGRILYWDSSLPGAEWEKWADIPFLSASLNYTAVLNTTKVSGQQLSSSIKQESGLCLSMTLMDSNSTFCNNIRKIMIGDNAGNTTFRFLVEFSDHVFPGYNNDQQVSIDFKLESCTMPTDKQSASVLTLLFRR